MSNQPDRPGRPGGRGAALGVGAVVLAVICCAGPILVAAGALGVLGGVLHNPLVLIAAAAVLTAGVLLTLRRAGAACNVPTVPPAYEKAAGKAHDTPSADANVHAPREKG